MPFQSIEEPIRVRQILTDAAAKRSEAVVWTEGQKHLFKSWVSPESNSREVRVYFPDSQSKADVGKLLSAIEKGTPGFIQITVRGYSIFAIPAKLIGTQDNQIRFEMPNRGVMLQRRESRRWAVPKAYELFFDTLDPSSGRRKIRTRIIDLSLGGFSFLATGRAAMIYRTGFLLRGSAMTIRRKKIFIDGVVKSVRSYEGGSTHRQVGVKIMKIAQEDREFLDHYLAEQLVQYGDKEAFEHGRRRRPRRSDQ